MANGGVANATVAAIGLKDPPEGGEPLLPVVVGCHSLPASCCRHQKFDKPALGLTARPGRGPAGRPGAFARRQTSC